MGAEGGDIILNVVCTIIWFHLIMRIRVKLHRNDRVQTIAADDQRRSFIRELVHCEACWRTYVYWERYSGQSLTSLGFLKPSALRPRFCAELPSLSDLIGSDEVEPCAGVLDGTGLSSSKFVTSSKAAPFQFVQPGSSTGCRGASHSFAASSHNIILIASCTCHNLANTLVYQLENLESPSHSCYRMHESHIGSYSKDKSGQNNKHVTSILPPGFHCMHLTIYKP